VTPFIWSIRRSPDSDLYEVRAWRYVHPTGWVPCAARSLATSFVAARALLPARSSWATTADAGTPGEVEWWQPAPPAS